MNEMLHTDTNKHASWIELPQVKAAQTIQNSFSKRVSLLDGTYFSYP